MKRLISLILAVMLVLALAIPAMATTLNIKEPSDKYKDATYAGYKLMTATNNETDKTKYAYTINEKYFDELKAATGLTDTEDHEVDGKDIIAYIANLAGEEKAAEMRAFTNVLYAIIAAAELDPDAVLETGDNEVEQGYWLIAQTSDAGDLETESLAMVDTVGLDVVNIESKKSIFTVDKKVSDESQLICGKEAGAITTEEPDGHVHVAGCYDWTKTNESPIGATVEYKIETQVPANMANYKYNAYFIVGDILSQGLTFKDGSIKVYIGGSETPLDTSKYTVKTAPDCEDDYTFQVALINPKQYAGKSVMIWYEATVNKDAVLTLTGNPNEADVTYNPDDDVQYGGDDTDGWPDEQILEVLGKSPKAYTITYATGIKFYKVDATTGTPSELTGAQFTITGTSESTVLKWVQAYVEAKNGETATHYKLVDNSFTDKAPTYDAMVKKTDETSFSGGYVELQHGESQAATDKVVENIRYRVATKDDFTAGTSIYRFVKGTIGDYADNAAKKYIYKEGWEAQDSTKQVNEILDVDAHGIARLPGLAEGTYTISETVVPKGFNKIPDITLVIDWEAPSTQVLTAKSLEAPCTWTVTANGETLNLDTIEADAYLYSLTIENKSGTELPSTGGIGTTIFYVLGGILLVGAAVLLITKKRMGTND